MLRPRRRSTALAAAAVAIVLASGLSACASGGEDASAELHASVVEVAERAAAEDYAGALAELDSLEQDLAEAVDAGRVDAAKEQEIRAALDVVRADLEAAEVATTPTPTPTPTPASDDDTGEDDKGKDDKDDDKGKDNDNKGKGNNNGND
ncbi:hypothetical protein [Agromyces sp. Marseille-Q5079]|uniref:hypothetical protein n=1 Tax=Agromyces sp. Marseille-Q5079 TaxID=3439059 RepID=UPI003D9CA278